MSTKVYVKRTFHPVGQGAFFTEQFYSDDAAKLLYNVVYDCGSKSEGIKTQMGRSIRNVFHDKKKIDVLFLSHFDDDHINFVKTLNDKGHLSGTKIFIPMLAAEKWLGITPYIFNYNYVLSLDDISRGGTTRVIRVKFDGDEVGELTLNNDPIIIEKIESDTISSGSLLQLNLPVQDLVWYYVPFNVQFNELIEKFREKLRNKGLDYRRLTDKDYLIGRIRELKQIYRSLGKKPSGGTAINLNSLLVMSYPKDAEKCCFVDSIRMSSYPCKHWMCHHNWIYPGSCLYTGDTSANEAFVWQRIEKIIDQCLGTDSILGLLQIPHHGSKNSCDDKLLTSPRFFAGFTNYDPYYRQHIFDDNLAMKLSLYHHPLVHVTKDYGSKYEEYWEYKTTAPILTV